MSSFTRSFSDLDIRALDDGIHWKLLTQFRYWTDGYHEGAAITAPEGFITDFASVPRFFWRILPPWGKYGKAAVLHDYNYWAGFLKKEIVDMLFKEGMQVLEVAGWKWYTMHKAVSWGGGSAWNNHRKNDANRIRAREEATRFVSENIGTLEGRETILEMMRLEWFEPDVNEYLLMRYASVF